MKSFNRYENIFKAEALYDNTVVQQFFRDIDKVVNCLRYIPNLSKIDRGFFVDYQNTTADVVTSKLVAHGWKVMDISDTLNRLQNADGWQIEVEDIVSGSSLLISRVLVLNDVVQPQVVSPLGQVINPSIPSV